MIITNVRTIYKSEIGTFLEAYSERFELGSFQSIQILKKLLNHY